MSVLLGNLRSQPNAGDTRRAPQLPRASCCAGAQERATAISVADVVSCCYLCNCGEASTRTLSEGQVVVRGAPGGPEGNENAARVSAAIWD